MFPEFLKDVNSPGLYGLLEDSRAAYNNAFDKIVSQEMARNKLLLNFQARNEKRKLETEKFRVV